MGQKMTDAMVQSQHDRMVVRVCKEAYVEAQQSVQWYQLDIGAGAFKRAFATHRNTVTTAVKRSSKDK